MQIEYYLVTHEAVWVTCAEKKRLQALYCLAFWGVHKVRLQNLAFFDHLPPSVYIFYGMKVYKNTYPPPLVNVVCEQLLVSFYLFLSLKEAWLKS